MTVLMTASPRKKELTFRVIRVRGTLAKLLKRRTFKAVVRSPQEAIRFLLANYPELESYMRPRYFQVTVGDCVVNEETIGLPTGVSEEICITPAICGAGGPAGEIFTGLGLIALSIFVPFAAPVLLPLGIGLTLTGVAGLILPATFDRPESTDSRDSYSFNGLQQTSREGPPAPLVYGEIVTGSIVLSVKVETDEEELAENFAAGAGNPSPDPNPVPDEDLDIDPANYTGGWRWYITISSNLQLGYNQTYEPGQTYLIEVEGEPDGTLHWVPYLSYGQLGYTPNPPQTATWTTDAIAVRDTSQTGLSIYVMQVGKERIVASGNQPIGHVVGIKSLVNSAGNVPDGTEFSISGYFKLYATRSDYFADTNAVTWSGY